MKFFFYNSVKMNFGGTIRLNKFGFFLIIASVILLALYITSGRQKLERRSVVSLKKLLIASIETAVKGGREVVNVYESSYLNERSKGKTKEGANDPITNADEKSNCAMYYSLTHTFSDIKVHSEEKSSESDCRTSQTLELDKIVLKNAELEDEQVYASDVTIWIDPLDATVEFTEKLLQFVTTMVCVAVHGEPVIGVIHFPFGEEPKTTWAWVGRGTSEEIKTKQTKILDDANPVVIISRSHSGKVESIVKEALGDGVNIVKAGGSGYKSLEVASKNVTAYIHTTKIKKWDICAGNAILNALNGKMTTLKNEYIDYGSEQMEVDSGILATLEKHDLYINKLKHLLQDV